MKAIFLTALFVLTSFVTGCDQIRQFDVSEKVINDYLSQKSGLQKHIGEDGVVSADITLSDLAIQIGRTEPGKVSFSGSASLKIDSLFGKTGANVNLTLSGQPFYQAELGAIYIKSMKIDSYKVSPEKMEPVVMALKPYLDTTIATYFDNQPVYVLNPEKNSAEAAAFKLAKGIEVKPGKFVIQL
ncbi:TPA: lipoprotein [Proteus mirabilis]|uniref:lipoprotein n=1 Tax=Proteus mirabilis TaxID=584 RepID=UPI0013981D8D|nr:lipoprotein [Proteus mirabilis]EKW1740621.1 lipoprotein [Proteus mirabilis]EKW4663099.1 lipoprotein [Proteus mirabilis]ELB1687020.1 lipoprotein [Proteus mirabilis]MDC9730404.1 lipoprotein [Proteus mirabilis]MDF7438265.1 lipoprotein [Proteus mirabilis]